MIQAIQGYKPTSKASLKQFCLIATQCKVEDAERLYDFMIKDMEDLPMFDPVPPTWVDNTKKAVGGFFDFVKENQDGIAQGYEFIRGIIASRGKELPPMGAGESVTAQPLPPINE